jgi:D-serine deaminase-like pyridoxal phosphate-dependent protein
MPEHWYHIDDINKIDSPALVVYKDRVQYNLTQAIQIAGDVSRLRPHVKTHKSSQLTKLMCMLHNSHLCINLMKQNG